MAFLLVQHAFQGLSGLAEDRYVNTFHLQGTGEPTQSQFVGIKEALRTFYSTTNGAKPIGGYMGQSANGAGRSVKIYDHQAVKPRAPLYEFIDEVVPFAVETTQGLPTEVACCISYSAAKLSGTVAARRRGRIFVGPLGVNTVEATGLTKIPRPIPGFRDSLLACFNRLLVDFSAAGHILSVYSPTNDPGDAGVVGAFTVVQSFWVDDAFDTQRRRGCAPTTREFGIISG